MIKTILTTALFCLFLFGTTKAQYTEIWSHDTGMDEFQLQDVVDINGDSYPDLYYISWADDANVFLNGHSGQVLWSSDYRFFRNHFENRTIGNLDYDSDLEIASSDRDSDSIFVVNAGTGVVEWSASRSLFGEPETALDINQDGCDELIFKDGRIIRCVGYTTRISDDQINGSTPGEMELEQNYPNPFNATTKIRYNLKKPSNARLDIYNLLGQRVETFFDDPQQAGEHSFIWDASDYSSGLYFYRIQAGDYGETRKMLLIK